MRRQIFLLAIGVFSLLGGAHIAQAGFGITPPYLRSNTLTQGSFYTQEIIIVRGDPIDDLKAEITINVPGINEWITVDKGLEFILPAGKTQVPMKISVAVPRDAKFGAYTGNVRIRTSSLKGPGTGVSIALGAQVDVNLKVVDKIFDFDVRRVELSEAEQGYKMWWLDFPGKITFWMHIENTGNVKAAPSKVHFDIYNAGGTQLLESVDNTNSIKEVAPFATERVAAYLPTWLPPGGYLVRFTIYKQNEISKTGEMTLSILPRGTIPAYVGYGLEGLSLNQKLTLIVPAGVLLLIILLIVLKITRRKGKKRPPASPKRPAPRQDSGGSERARTSERSAVVDLSRPRGR